MVHSQLSYSSIHSWLVIYSNLYSSFSPRRYTPILMPLLISVGYWVISVALLIHSDSRQGASYPLVHDNSTDTHTLAVESECCRDRGYLLHLISFLDCGNMLIMVYAQAAKSGDGALLSRFVRFPFSVLGYFTNVNSIRYYKAGRIFWLRTLFILVVSLLQMASIIPTCRIWRLRAFSVSTLWRKLPRLWECPTPHIWLVVRVDRRKHADNFHFRKPLRSLSKTGSNLQSRRTVISKPFMGRRILGA